MYVARPLANLSPRPDVAKRHDVSKLGEVSVAQRDVMFKEVFIAAVKFTSTSGSDDEN